VSLLFAGQDTVFLAYPERYCTLSISSAANEVELFSPGKKKQPLMCVLPDGEIMLVRDGTLYQTRIFLPNSVSID
jgi:hypothetical protein